MPKNWSSIRVTKAVLEKISALRARLFESYVQGRPSSIDCCDGPPTVDDTLRWLIAQNEDHARRARKSRANRRKKSQAESESTGAIQAPVVG